LVVLPFCTASKRLLDSGTKQSNYWRLAYETSTTESCHAIKWTFLFTGDLIKL